jgi:hypothetical protein
VVVILAGAAAAQDEAGTPDASQLVRGLLREGLKPSVVAREAARRLAVPRSEAYRLALELADERKE